MRPFRRLKLLELPLRLPTLYGFYEDMQLIDLVGLDNGLIGLSDIGLIFSPHKICLECPITPIICFSTPEISMIIYDTQMMYS